jgi:hypothetical protein
MAAAAASPAGEVPGGGGVVAGDPGDATQSWLMQLSPVSQVPLP